MDKRLKNAIAAGWNPADGDPPHEHGEFVEGLESSDDINDLLEQPNGQ